MSELYILTKVPSRSPPVWRPVHLALVVPQPPARLPSAGYLPRSLPVHPRLLARHTTLRPLTFTPSQLMAELPVVDQPPPGSPPGRAPSDGRATTAWERDIHLGSPSEHVSGGQCECLCIISIYTHQGPTIPSHSPWLLPPSLIAPSHLASDDCYRPSGGTAPARLTSLPSDGCSRAPSDTDRSVSELYILTKVPSRSPPVWRPVHLALVVPQPPARLPSAGYLPRSLPVHPRLLARHTTLRPLTFTPSQLMAELPVVDQPPPGSIYTHQVLTIPSHSAWPLPPVPWRLNTPHLR